MAVPKGLTGAYPVTMLMSMSRRNAFRSCANSALCGLIALVATGLPLSHDADHRSDAAHLEHDHGGHGTVLVEQDVQLLGKPFSFAAVPGAVTARWTEALAVVEPRVHARTHAHRGRDPPAESRPRAPPSNIS